MELSTIQWDKKTVMNLLKTIEGDKELKSMFCEMMDSYESAIYSRGKTLRDEIRETV